MKWLTRRRFLLASAATAALARGIQTESAAAQEYHHPWNERTDPDAEGLTGYLNHGNLLVRRDNLPLLGYRAHPSLKYPYFFPWFTRDYGHLSPQPFVFLKEPFRLARGETLELKYRIALHGGSPEEAGMPSLFREWASSMESNGHRSRSK